MTGKRWVCLAVVCLLMVQTARMVYVVHRESLTFDEDNHMFAGYMMWHTGDYGLNPDHPPLVKLLATTPLLGRDLWVPPLLGHEFKAESYLDGRAWLARNDGSSQHMVFQMRLAAGLLALGLSLVVFFAAREWFGTTAGLVALVLVTFDPNLPGHSALVTTDIGVTLFFLASIYAFYRYAKQPTMLRLALVGGEAGEAELIDTSDAYNHGDEEASNGPEDRGKQTDGRKAVLERTQPGRTPAQGVPL